MSRHKPLSLSIPLVLLLTLATTIPTFAADPTTKPNIPTDQPSTKLDPKTHETSAAWLDQHNKLAAHAKQGNVDLLLLGDSITANWMSTKNGNPVFDKAFAGYNAAAFGIGGDRTEHVLWRLDHDELTGISPKLIVLLIGTNNANDKSGEEIAAGAQAIVKELRAKQPQAHIVLMAIFNRGDMKADTPPSKRRDANTAANKILATANTGDDHVTFLDINDKFPPVDSPDFATIFPGLLHPNAKGYEIWAAALQPYITQYLGAPTTTAPATAPAN